MLKHLRNVIKIMSAKVKLTCIFLLFHRAILLASSKYVGGGTPNFFHHPHSNNYQ